MGDMTIGIGLDVQKLHDDAVTASEAFEALAGKLAERPTVCTHPSEDRTARPIDDGYIIYCDVCSTILHDDGTMPEEGE